MTEPDMKSPVENLTKEQILARAKELFITSGKGATRHDQMGIFQEWLISEPAEFPNVGSWMRKVHPDVHKVTIQAWGGAEWWNKARQAMRVQAMGAAIEKAIPNGLAAKYEKQLRIIGKLEDIVERAADRMKRATDPLADGTLPPAVPFESATLKTLAESVRLLAETNMKLAGDDISRSEVKSLNLHGNVMDAIKARDKEFNVSD